MMEMKMTTDLSVALPQSIEFNFEELEAELTERLYHYNNLVVTEDAIKEAKADLANLRKLKDAIETRRKEVKQQCMAPYNAFEARVKKLTALIDAPVAAINEQVKAFDRLEQAKKLEAIAATYEELVQDSIRDIIPLKRILDQKWLNKTTTMKSITEEITKLVKRTNVDLVLIDGVNPQYMAAVRAKYIETLDITTALNYQDELRASEERFRQQEEARAQREAQRAALESQTAQAQKTTYVAVQEPVRQAAPQPGTEEKLYSLRLEFHLTMDQANALKSFLAENNINYVKMQGGN